jgi:hypothetical protein
MKVYLVIGKSGFPCGEEVAAVFYCKEDAEAYCVANYCYRVEEWDVQ